MENSKRIFTVPNILTFVRIIAVPIMMYFVIASAYGQPEWFLYIGLGINVFAALTDLVDGYIARHFNQISDLGKVLDPFADKFMTIMMFVALVVIGNVHWAFLLVIGLKEAIMVGVGAVVLPKKKIIIPSNIYGKVAMWFVTIGILMSFFHKYLKYIFYIDWVVLGIGAVLTYVALVSYACILVKKLKEPETEVNAELAEDASTVESAESIEEETSSDKNAELAEETSSDENAELVEEASVDEGSDAENDSASIEKSGAVSERTV